MPVPQRLLRKSLGSGYGFKNNPATSYILHGAERHSWLATQFSGNGNEAFSSTMDDGSKVHFLRVSLETTHYCLHCRLVR